MAIKTEDFAEAIQSHMDDQPYKAKCGGCHGDLDVHASVDSDYDLDLTIEPCETCMEEQFDLGQKA